MTNRTVLIVLVFAGVYLLTLASAHPLDAVFGVLLGAALLWALRRFLLPSGSGSIPGLVGRFLRAPLFAAVIVREITVGTWDVVLVMIGLRRIEIPGIVAFPIGERTELGVVVTTITATLSPGEFLVDVDWEKGVYYLHVLDARDPDASRAHHAYLYERFQKAVFP